MMKSKTVMIVLVTRVATIDTQHCYRDLLSIVPLTFV